MSLPKFNTPPSSSFPRKSQRNPRASHLRAAEPSILEHQQQRKLDRTASAPENGPTERVLTQQDDGQDVLPTFQHQFKPFFALIKDTNSSEHHHPTVHYIFSDDDTDIITEAAFHSLEIDNGPGEKNLRPREEQEPSAEAYDRNELESAQSISEKPSLLPPPIPGVKERYIILDVEPLSGQPQVPGQLQSPDIKHNATGVPVSSTPASSTQNQANQTPTVQLGQTFRIASAHSLTPNWQVLNTHLNPAPTFDTINDTPSSEPSAHPANGALMLHIEGTTGLPRYAPSRDSKDLANRRQGLEDMMDQFEKRMAELRCVIEAGEIGMKEVVETEEVGDDETAKDSNRCGAAISQPTIIVAGQPPADSSGETAET
jgi:hypothetical protein